MMGQFETRSIADLLARNFDTIKDAYHALDPDGDYEAFVSANEEILACTPEIDLYAFMEGRPIKIFGSSETMSRLHSLQYAYLLTRYAQKTADENRFENALLVLSEACFYSGFAEGMGESTKRKNNRIDPSLNASHAAKTKHAQNSAPVKRCFLELLEAKPRQEKWKTIGNAVRAFPDELAECIRSNKLALEHANLPATIAEWCKHDSEFREKLSQFVCFEK